MPEQEQQSTNRVFLVNDSIIFSSTLNDSIIFPVLDMENNFPLIKEFNLICLRYVSHNQNVELLNKFFLCHISIQIRLFAMK